MSTGSDSVEDERSRLMDAIASLDAQREALGDGVIDAAAAPLQARLAALDIASQRALPRALRQVSIVFVDIVDSTRLSARLDPEELDTLIDGALARFATIVVDHGGRVVQTTGDGLLAAFGADAAREDDAERAVRAGLALIADARAHEAAVRRAHAIEGFAVRIGAHSGVVLVGPANGTVTVGGVAVNIAARMEQTAPPGALRISRDTWRLVRERFDCEEQPPIAVKGIATPVVSYLVRAERERSLDALGDTSSASMVGRDAELDAIVATVDATRADRQPRLFTVVGDAGLGKSRLLQEVSVRLADDTTVVLLRARAERHGAEVPYGVVRDLFARRCGILDSDDAATARAKLGATLAATFDARVDERCALVGQLIGLDFSHDPHIAGIVRDGAQIRARAFHAIAQYLGALAVQRSCVVLLLLDDLHSADAGSLDWIESLAGRGADAPLVVGGFARPTLLERRPAWGEASPRATRIDLAPLGDDGSARLLDSLFTPGASVPDALRGLVLRHAAGNPFHIQELLGMLVDEGVVFADDDGWRVEQARLDALPAYEKAALQEESVIGATFWDDALRALDPRSLPALDPLLARDLIRARAESTFAGVREFEFKHHLLHQVTYDTVLKAVKRTLHQKTADWLVAVTGARIGEHLGLIADHYERAGNVESASRFLHRAADAAYWTGAVDAARGYLARALALPGIDDRLRFELHLTSSHVNNATGRRAEQHADVDVLESLADALGDDALRARAWRQRIPLLMLDGDSATAFEVAQRAEALAARVGDDVTRGGAAIEGAQALIELRRHDEAVAALEAALPVIRRTDRKDLESVALGRLHVIALQRNDFDAARAYLERSLVVDRALGNRRWEGSTISNLAVLEFLLGRLDRARELTLEAQAIQIATGARGSLPYQLDTIAMCDFEQGRPHDALAGLTAALHRIREAGDHYGERIITIDLAEVHAALGHTDAALAALDDYDRAGIRLPIGSAGDVARVSLYVDLGRLADAEPLVTAMVADLDARGASEDRDARLLFACHRWLAATAHPRATEFLDRAWAVLSRVADGLDDEGRATYLGALRLHRAIVASRAARDAGR